jgi:hypothetical protein
MPRTGNPEKLEGDTNEPPPLYTKFGRLWRFERCRVYPWQTISAFAREMDDFVRGPAVKDHPLRQISKHVWIIFSPDGFPTPENQGMMCNITFVDTAKGLVVVDSGASVQIGEMAIRQVKKQFNKPVIAIINTHYHGDHWLGNHAYVDAYGSSLPLYSHPGTIKAIQGVQGNMWRTLMEQWTNQATIGTRVVPPTSLWMTVQSSILGTLLCACANSAQYIRHSIFVSKSSRTESPWWATSPWTAVLPTWTMAPIWEL